MVRAAAVSEKASRVAPLAPWNEAAYSFRVWAREWTSKWKPPHYMGARVWRILDNQMWKEHGKEMGSEICIWGLGDCSL